MKHLTKLSAIPLSLVLALVVGACAVQPPAAPAETEPETVEEVMAEEEMAEEEMAAGEKEATLAIEHFSIIEGTTWSGAHDRAGKRIAEKYPNVEYIYREEVGPDLTVPYAEEMIAEGASIVVGNAEFMGHDAPGSFGPEFTLQPLIAFGDER